MPETTNPSDVVVRVLTDIAATVADCANMLSRLDCVLQERLPPKAPPALSVIAGKGRGSKKPPAKLESAAWLH
jgi:hypothetical protein